MCCKRHATIYMFLYLTGNCTTAPCLSQVSASEVTRAKRELVGSPEKVWLPIANPLECLSWHDASRSMHSWKIHIDCMCCVRVTPMMEHNAMVIQIQRERTLTINCWAAIHYHKAKLPSPVPLASLAYFKVVRMSELGTFQPVPFDVTIHGTIQCVQNPEMAAPVPLATLDYFVAPRAGRRRVRLFQGAGPTASSCMRLSWCLIACLLGAVWVPLKAGCWGSSCVNSLQVAWFSNFGRNISERLAARWQNFHSHSSTGWRIGLVKRTRTRRTTDPA